MGAVVQLQARWTILTKSPMSSWRVASSLLAAARISGRCFLRVSFRSFM
jgi:hypothetical protein